MGSKLYVGNIPFTSTEDELRSLFAANGRNVRDVIIPTDRDTGRPRGFAFVELGSDAEAQSAIQELDGASVQGRTIQVNEARERTPRPGGGGGGGGGGGRFGGGGGGGGGRFGGGGGGGGGRGGRDRDRDRDRERW